MDQSWFWVTVHHVKEQTLEVYSGSSIISTHTFTCWVTRSAKNVVWLGWIQTMWCPVFIYFKLLFMTCAWHIDACYCSICVWCPPPNPWGESSKGKTEMAFCFYSDAQVVAKEKLVYSRKELQDSYFDYQVCGNCSTIWFLCEELAKETTFCRAFYSRRMREFFELYPAQMLTIPKHAKLFASFHIL